MQEKTYEALSELFQIVLEELIENKDFENLKQFVVLSQFFYKESNKNRILLYNSLKSNNIWKDLDLWENLIKCKILIAYLVSINDEIDRQNLNKNDFIYGQLIFYALMIIDNDVSKENVEKFFEKMVHFYDLPNEKLLLLLLLINDNLKDKGIIKENSSSKDSLIVKTTSGKDEIN